MSHFVPCPVQCSSIRPRPRAPPSLHRPCCANARRPPNNNNNDGGGDEEIVFDLGSASSQDAMQQLEAAGLRIRDDGSFDLDLSSLLKNTSTNANAPPPEPVANVASRINRALQLNKQRAGARSGAGSKNSSPPSSSTPSTSTPADNNDMDGWFVAGADDNGGSNAGWEVSPFDSVPAIAKNKKKKNSSSKIESSWGKDKDNDNDNDDAISYLERESEKDENRALLKRSTARPDLTRAAMTLLDTIPTHELSLLEAFQREADIENKLIKKANVKRREKERKTHRRLRIVGGDAAGKFLISSQGENTRPMMEKVRGAVFNMLTSVAGGVFPTETRWLDLFAGTGAIGLEALSRGCLEAHFVELDPWVCRTVLNVNVRETGMRDRSTIHTTDVLDFLKRSQLNPSFAGGAFDLISCCPPYVKVSYPDLLRLLSTSPLVAPHTLLLVEYPKESDRRDEIPETLGNLVMLRNREYGRTHVVIYGPPDAALSFGDEIGEEEIENEQDVV